MREASVVGFIPSNSARTIRTEDFATGLLQSGGNAFPLMTFEIVARQKPDVMWRASRPG